MRSPGQLRRGYWIGMRKGGALQEEVATAKIEYVKPVFLIREKLVWLTQNTGIQKESPERKEVSYGVQK